MPSDPLGPDGTVRLRSYQPLADRMYFSGSCPACERGVTVGIEAAVDLMGSVEATIGQLGRRLVCRGCGGRIGAMQVMADSRTPETREREGRLPETVGVRVRE
jgi:hypothetical protein